MKVAIITCYKYPDYGRAVVLRAGLQANPEIKTIVIKNRHRSVLRYPEVLIKTFVARLSQRPDVYLLTFRGYEILPAILLIALGKPVILDELVNPIEVVNEHRGLYRGKLKGKLMGLWRVFGGLYSWLLRRCRLVIADTYAHATYSAQSSGLSIDRYRVIPVGADETIFKSAKHPATHTHSQSANFMVLYYGSMVPLHGLDYVLKAAVDLRDQTKVSFLLVGGGPKAIAQIAEARANGAHIEHRRWIEPSDLPAIINRAGLCLGGPFGNSLQSALVTTGKTYQFLASGAPALIGETKETRGSKLFKNRVNCLMVPQGKAEAIAEAITWAAAHPAEMATIGQKGYELYQQHFSGKIISRKLASLLSELS